MTADDVTLREALDADAEGLIELIGSCWSEYPGVVLDVDREVPELRRIASAFRELGGRFWVLEVEGRIIGSVGVVPSARGGGVELRKLYVARELRRRGLGARLAGLVEEEARRRGATFVELWSDVRFTDGHRLYERLGYARTGRTRELHDLSGTVEAHFRKRLA